MVPENAARLRAVVIGGSIGGLTAALALRAAGVEVDVFERSKGELSSRGAGLGMQTSLVRAVADHGIDPAAVSTSSHRLRYHDTNGDIAFEGPARGRYTAWNTLYKALLDAFGRSHYHHGAALSGISDKGTGVVATFEDGRQEWADLLVAADGFHSTVRTLIDPAKEPVYAGYVGWRALVPERDLPRRLWETFDDSISYCLARGERSHIIVYPVPGANGEIGAGGRRVNFVWYWNVAAGDDLEDLLTDRNGEYHRTGSVPAGKLADRHVARMRRIADDVFAPCVAELVRAAREPFAQQIVELGMPQMAFGRTCLVGDAAFTVRPHAGAATAKVAEDAWALGRALRDADGDVLAALDRWQRRQLPIGEGLLERCAELGDRSQVHGTWRPGDPTLAPGLFGPADHDRPDDW